MSDDALTPSEQDFVTWMDELDLEQVNLLGEPLLETRDAMATVLGDSSKSNQLNGERRDVELPASKNIGWDTK
jgi:hypothetical protein